MRLPSNYTVPLLLLSAMLLLACSNIAEIPARYSSSDEFSIAQLVAYEYLVVKITVTKDGIETGATKLIRGPTATSSEIADLMVIPTAGGKEIGAYAMPDPRFQRIEGGAWEIVEPADALIFVPLSADIDLVTIRPVRGREHVAPQPDDFDPRPLAEEACREAAERHSVARTPLAELVEPYSGAVTRSSEMVTNRSDARTPYEGCDQILALPHDGLTHLE